MANNYSLFNSAPMQASGLLLPETAQEQNLKRQQRIAEYEQREMMRKQKEQAMMEEASKFWQSLNPAQKVGMSPVGFPFTDAVGLAGDVQMYKENPEMRSTGNYAMSGLGLLPFVPSVVSTVLKKKPIKAYHGTSHDFDKFDMSKLGSGTGAQFKGKGLYFTESQDLAKAYKKEAARIKEIRDLNKRIQLISSEMKKYEKPGGGYRNFTDQRGYDLAETYDDLISKRSNAVNYKGQKEGYMYKVNLNTSKDELMDWSQPLGKQPKKTKEGIKTVNQNLTEEQINNLNLSGSSNKRKKAMQIMNDPESYPIDFFQNI